MIHASISASNSPRILVVMGSIRAGRLCPQIASWVVDIAGQSSGLSYELVDLADWPLPMDDEPGIPEGGEYSQPHTRAWSAKITAADGFVFVTPQYNWGYPAPLKNAIDHLYKEWEAKPLVIVTYGGHGGGKCGSHLRQVAEGVHLLPTTTMPGITLRREIIKGAPLDPAKDFTAEDVQQVRQAIWELSAALEKTAG